MRTDLPHVLTLTDTIGHGGAERIAVEIALGTDPERFRRTVCVSRSLQGDPESLQNRDRLVRAGVTVLELDRGGRADLAAWRRLAGYIRRERVDVVHAHKFGSNVWGAILGRSLRVPVVVGHEHTWSFEGQPVRRLLDRWVVAAGSDAVVAVSNADRRRMIAVVGMPADRVVLIPNGIAPRTPEDPGALRRELGLAPDAPVIALVAVLRPQKAIDVMLDALAIVRRTRPSAHLVVAGPGDPSALRAQARRLGVAEGVSLLGPRGDIADILAAADVGALSSDFEGSPLVVLEYMAAGLPVVATAVGGVPDMVVDGESGLLVAPRDPDALAGALTRVLGHPELARRLGAAGRARQERVFSNRAMIEQVLALYARLLAAQGAGARVRAGAGEDPAGARTPVA